jgi:glycosyltransferase involved in cell wall biosynthesis
MKKVTAIVPCLNEEERIGAVLTVLTTYPDIQKVIVVDDNSTDSTKEVAKQFPVKLIVRKKSRGKGSAVKYALKYVRTEIVLLCDADLIGLEHKHVRALVRPVQKSGNIMTVAMLDKYWQFGSNTIKESLMFLYLLINGTRALLTRHLRKASAHELFENYGIEPVLNFYCRKNKIGIKRVNLKGVKDVIKIRKKHYGWIPHIKETINVTGVYSQLYAQEVRKQLRKLQRSHVEDMLERIKPLKESVSGRMLHQIRKHRTRLQNFIKRFS